MHPFRSLSRIFVPAALLPSLALAVPTAVNDTFTTPEDVAAGSAAVEVINANFEPAFTLPNAWQIIDLATTAAGGTNTYPRDGDNVDWKAVGYDTTTSTIPGWRAGTLPAQGGGIMNTNFAAVPATLTGLVPGGPNTVNTYLFRSQFTMTAAQAAHPAWSFNRLADDGCIIYINGVARDRLNYPDGVAVNPDAMVGTTGDENNYNSRIVDMTGAFVAGTNVLAIELHQSDGASSDAGLDFQMTPADATVTGGFTGVDDTFFGTAQPNFSAQTHAPTGGFNGTGALGVAIGNVLSFQGSAASGAWRKTFTLASATTVTLSFRHRMISQQDYDNNEYQELICDVNGIQYGTATAPSTHLAVNFQVGNGNGGGVIDGGWKQSTFNIPLAAGVHTLSLGGYQNAGSTNFQGTAQERFEGFFDDVLLNVPGSVSLLGNDTGGVAPVTAVKASDPANGAVTVNADGSFNYLPAANWFGVDTFTYKAVDGTGESAPATVTLNVTSVNDIPVAVADGPHVTPQDEPLVVGVEESVLVNDTDVETAVLTAVMDVSPNGTTVLNADGSFTFTPNARFAGAASFTYRASDGTAQSAPATVTINVTDFPDPPTALADTYTAVKNTPLVVTATAPGTTTDEVLPYASAGWHYFDSIVPAQRNQGTAWRTDAYTENADWKIGAAELGYDSPPDEVTVINDNPDPAFAASATDRFATYYFRRTVDLTDFHNITGFEISIIYDDACAFYLNGNKSGRTTNLPDLVTMPELAWDFYPTTQINDNSSQNFPLPVSALLSGPNLIAAEVHQNGPTSGDISFDLRLRAFRATPAGVLSNDLDPDVGQKATLTAEVVAVPAHGALVLNTNGTFTYTPANGYTGPDSFTYFAKDSTNLTSAVTAANISVINGPNVAPIANADNYTVAEDTSLNRKAGGGVLANDTDAEGDPFTAVIATPPSHGTLTLNPNGSFDYQPVADFNGTDAFTYRATDTRPSAPGTVTITVDPVNDEPLAANDIYSGDPGMPFIRAAAQGLLSNDSDVDAAGTVLTAEIVTPPSSGTLTLNTDGSFTFIAATGGVYTFTYRAKDATSQSASATVTISLDAVPVTQPDSYDADEDSPLSRTAAQGVLANDSDPESQPLTAALVANVQHGTITLSADGSFIYVPAANFFGSDSFTYRASDGTPRTPPPAPVTVSLTVLPVNDPPVAVADTYGVRVETPLAITAAGGVLRNDTDVDNPTLTAALVSPPADGALVLNADGSFTYSPAPGFSGVRTFTYRNSDGTVQSAIVTVTLNVTADLNTLAISEIMYNPPGATGVQEEFIEVFNYGDAAVDLTGWEFTKGVNYLFEPGSLIPGKGYLAVPANSTAFAAKYPGVTNVTSTSWGPDSGLGNGGETIRLRNAGGEQVDEVTYADEGDWAVRKIVNVWRATNTPGAAPPPVGNLGTNPGLEWVTTADPNPEIGNPGGSSLQVINAALSNKAGQNWTAAAPTPGAANAAVAQTNSAPLIRDVTHSPAVPNRTQQVFVTARIEDELLSGYAASAFYRTWQPSSATPDTANFTEAVMADNGLRGDGAAGDGVFGAVIPAQALNTVVEFYVSAADAASNVRTWPAPTLDLNGTSPQQNANCLYQVNEEVWTDHRPFYQLVMTGADNVSWNAGIGDRQSNVAPNTTVIFRHGGDFNVRYRGSIRARGNSSRSDTPMNLRMDIPGDDPWNGRTAFTLNYKYSYSQFLGSRLYEAAGVPCEKSGVAGMRLNGANRILDGNGARTFGYYADLIPRGGDTIKEWFPGNDNGNSYGKIRGNQRWRVSTLPTIGAAGYATGGYVNEGYTKQTNVAQNDWTDLHAWMTSLNAGTNENFETVIAGTVDIDQWCRFLAVSTIINHGETNMANGDDDDYSVYFGATDRLARIIPHDLDTCFNLRAIGLGDEDAPPTTTIYQCTDPSYIDNATLPQMDKFYRNPVTGRKFKATLRHYLDTLFAKPKFDATVDQLLDSQWLGTQFAVSGNANGGETIRAHIKAFLDTRRATIETFLPTAFTAVTTLTVQNGLPRSTSGTDLGGLGGKIDPARTAEVKVNGVKVTTNPYGSTAAADNSWSAGTALTLHPGLNTLVCTAHDESGSVFATQTITIWYDAAGTNKSGSLAASETWTPSGGPYNVTASLTVPSGVVLTIEPGTTVFLATGANITVSGGGRLVAQGTANAGITFTRIPSGTGNWGNLTVRDASALPTVLSYLTFENNGSVALHTQNGANVEVDHLTFQNTAVGFLSFDGSSFLVRDCVFPSSTASFEPVHGSGGIAAGGRGIIEDCWFGKTQGYSDSIDFTGGNRPGPIIHVLRCVFTGSDDDILDLDSTDAWVEGNVFMHCHRNGTSPDSSSGVSGGADNTDFSQVTVINNLFYDCDNAVTMKQGNQPNGNSAVLLYNTIVHITKTGGIDTGSGVVNFDDDNVNGEGKGMYLEGNIIQDVESLARNYDPALSQFTLINNILPVAPPASATASGNVVTDPLLNLSLITTPATATLQQVVAALRPQLCSPALASGPLGGNKGADLSRRGIRVQTPSATGWPANVTLNAGPGGSFTPTGQVAWAYGFTHYKYRLDSRPESAEIPVSTPLTLPSLTSGPHTLAVQGKDDSGVWQENAFSVTFMVVADAPTIALSEIVAAPLTGLDWIELHNYGTAAANLAGCTLFANDSLPAKLTFAAGTSIPAGGRIIVDTTQLGFNLNRGGETITLWSPASGVVDSVTFGPQVTGLSIARVGSAWMLSTPTPAADNTAVCVLGTGTALHINEWIGSNDIIVSGDFVELYNGEANPVSLTGWSLSQDLRNEPAQNVFPPLSFIAASGFLELIADGDSTAGADHLNFKVSSIHDSIALLNPAGQTADNVFVLPGNPDVSQGRLTDGSALTGYLPLPTPGFSNESNLTADSALMSSLRITEIMFDPPGSGAEYIELKNISAADLTITGVTFPTGITFTFPATTLTPGTYTVITHDLAKFHAPGQFPAVPAVQWTSGRLDNNGETIRLETAAYGLGILDFRYEGDWYPETRTGAALEIIDPAAPRGTWGDKASWQPGVPTPGGPSAFGVLAPPDVTVLMPDPAILHGFVSPGSFAAGSITVAWSKVSGPGSVTFTAPANKDTDANFSAPGTYELRLTATPPGGAPSASDTVIVNVAESYDSWAVRTLAGFSSAQQEKTADPDNDGIANLIEHVLGTNPAAYTAGPELILSGGHLALRYRISKLADPAIQIIPQISGAPGTWQDGPAVINDFLSSETSTSFTRIAEDTGTLGGSLKKFLRLKIVSP